MALTRAQDAQKLGNLGPFVVERELSTSGVGATFLAKVEGQDAPEGLHAGDSVLIVRVHRHMARPPSAVEEFRAEGRAAKALRHPHVVSVYESGIVDNEPYVVFEHAGDNLAAILRLVGPTGIPDPVALRIAIDVLHGLQGAHEHDPPIGHGELGPWCVHIGENGLAKVSGFAVDRAIVRFGTHYVKNVERLSFAAPERVRAMSSTLGQQLSSADERSDLFSACVLVYELLTRQRLFGSKMEAAVVQKVLTANIPSPQTLRPDLA